MYGYRGHNLFPLNLNKINAVSCRKILEKKSSQNNGLQHMTRIKEACLEVIFHESRCALAHSDNKGAAPTRAQWLSHSYLC